MVDDVECWRLNEGLYCILRLLEVVGWAGRRRSLVPKLSFSEIQVKPRGFLVEFNDSVEIEHWKYNMRIAISSLIMTALLFLGLYIEYKI